MIIKSYRIRFGLYVFTSVGTLFVGYLFDKEVIGQVELAFWGGLVTFVSGLAAFNTTPDDL